MHLVWDSQRLSFSHELTPTLTLGLRLGLALGLGLASFQHINFFTLTKFKAFSLNVFDDTHLLHLIWASQRLSFSKEVTPTLTLGLSLGLGLARGHFQDMKFFTLASFKVFSLEVFDDTPLLDLIWNSQRLSFSQEVTPTLTLGLSLGLGLARGHFQDMKFFTFASFKVFSLEVFDDTPLLRFVWDSQRLLFSQELTPTLTLKISLGLGLGLARGHLEDLKFFTLTNFKVFSLKDVDATHYLHLV